MLSAQLGIGTLLDHDGVRFEVVEFAGHRLLLRQIGVHSPKDFSAVDSGGELVPTSADGEDHRPGKVRQVEIGWLLSHPSTRILTRLSGQEDDEKAVGNRQQSDELRDVVSAGAVLGDLDAAQAAQVAERVEHVREVMTGFRRGSADLALPGEPRAEYGPGSTRMDRYAAKAAQIGVGVSTIRRWVAAFRDHGPAGLVQDVGGSKGGLGRTDERWLEMCRVVLGEHVTGSRPTRAIILAEIAARLGEKHGPGTVVAPSRSVAYEVLRELSRGTNAFTGSTKGKRSIADRPAGVYGSLRATRPGEYVLLDTTRLDVFAMEAVTCRWVRAELTVAMDLYTRAITGLRLTPVSTKAVDVAGVLFETIHPRTDTGGGGPEALACPGIPDTVVLDAGKLVDSSGGQLLAGMAAETIVYDHGQIYISEHVESVCARFGISLQPARPGTPTDKSPVERWFRTLADGLLVALPGYKGADVHSRGLDVQDEAFFFLHELEAIIREWISLCYHARPHRGLCVPEVPGLTMSPRDMFAHGIHRAGYLSVPARPDLAYDFLQVRWTTIQHYGVEINGLRYNGAALIAYRNRTSAYTGTHAGKWPISVDPADVRAVYFQDPTTRAWHSLAWAHAGELEKPFSSEALTYARRLAARTQRFPDPVATLMDLLERWGAGLTEGAAERRMALRLAQQNLRLLPEETTATPAADVAALPSIRHLSAIGALPPAEDSLTATSPSPLIPAGTDAGHDRAHLLDDVQPTLEDHAVAVDPPEATDATVTATHAAQQPAVGPSPGGDFYADVMDSA